MFSSSSSFSARVCETKTPLSVHGNPVKRISDRYFTGGLAGYVRGVTWESLVARLGPSDPPSGDDKVTRSWTLEVGDVMLELYDYKDPSVDAEIHLGSRRGRFDSVTPMERLNTYCDLAVALGGEFVPKAYGDFSPLSPQSVEPEPWDPFDASLEVRSGQYFVKIDRGYVGYGRGGRFGSTSVERLAHFLDRGDPELASKASLTAWAEGFLSSLPAMFGKSA